MGEASASEIIPGLFIGNIYSSFRAPFLQEHNIKSVLSVIHESWAMWQRKSFSAQIGTGRHMCIWCLDSTTQDLLVHFTQACDFIEESLKFGPVLVHCSEGISRSATFVIAYLMRKERRGVQELLAEMREKRNKVRPSKNFLAQLEVWRELDYDVWEDGDKKVPKAAYAKIVEEKKLTTEIPRL